MKWYAGCDHAGLALKSRLLESLTGLGDEVVDLGCQSEQSVDYPDYALAVARNVASDPGSRGLLVCGTGIGMSMTANRVPGVRAAVVTDEFTARATREHNDANVICLGARVLGEGLAGAALLAFRNTDFAGGRHQRRLDKIAALEGPSRPPGAGGGGPARS